MGEDLISRQAAIDAIMGQPPEPHYPSWYAELIEKLPSAQSEHSQNTPQKQPDLETFGVKTGETCADAISRQEVIEIFTQLWDCVGEIADKDEWEDVCKTTANGLPSAQPRKKGKWIYKPNIYGVAYCSECDFELHINDTPYCPYCGAEMKGEEDETD